MARRKSYNFVPVDPDTGSGVSLIEPPQDFTDGLNIGDTMDLEIGGENWGTYTLESITFPDESDLPFKN